MMLELERADVLYVLITSVLYFVFLLGVFIIYSERMKSGWAKLIMHNRLNARKRALKPQTRLEIHLRKVLSISLKKQMEPKMFIRLNLLIFLLIIIVGIQNVSFASAFFMALLISSTPYLILRVRIESIRRKSSYEGEKLVAEFLCQYRISNFNIYKTIEQVILVSQDTRISGALLFKLLLELRNTGNAQIIKESTERFAYGINTNWSRMLANCIRISAESGINVSLALEDVLIQLREARALFEERKRLNSESVRMVVFLAPLMYGGTILLSVKYLGIPFGKLIRNQLYTEQGFLLMLLTTFLFLVNIALIEMINNQRFDY